MNGFVALLGTALWALAPGFIASFKGRSFWGWYFLSFLITPLLSMIITLFLSSKSENTYTETSHGSRTSFCFENQNLLPKFGKYSCKQCDEKLLEGCAFCHKCGAKYVYESENNALNRACDDLPDRVNVDRTQEYVVCPCCGTRQLSNRLLCWSCGVRFE